MQILRSNDINPFWRIKQGLRNSHFTRWGAAIQNIEIAYQASIPSTSSKDRMQPQPSSSNIGRGRNSRG
ncbi:MAG: hypothetical protein P8163_13705 [Candidatus Thiodiazotropha sp.]